MGATPQSMAQAASDRIRSGLSPATMQFCGGVGADAERGNQVRGQRAGQLGQQSLVRLDLGVEMFPAPSDCFQGVFAGGGDRGDRAGS